jgi:hypothetical protein
MYVWTGSVVKTFPCVTEHESLVPRSLPLSWSRRRQSLIALPFALGLQVVSSLWWFLLKLCSQTSPCVLHISPIWSSPIWSLLFLRKVCLQIMELISRYFSMLLSPLSLGLDMLLIAPSSHTLSLVFPLGQRPSFREVVRCTSLCDSIRNGVYTYT